MNMAMTFVLHPLSHCNSITEPHARFLLSLLEYLTIDFPSHFILSIIDVHLDLASCDKLVFHSVYLTSFPLSLMTKKGSSFDMKVVNLRGRVSIGPFFLGGVLIHFEGCSEDSMYLFFSFLLDTLLLYMRSCDNL